jgi:hypothetical protein
MLDSPTLKYNKDFHTRAQIVRKFPAPTAKKTILSLANGDFEEQNMILKPSINYY